MVSLNNETRRNQNMLRNISKTVGSAMAALCLVSTLAMAQYQNPPPASSRPQNPAVSDTRSQYPSQHQPLHMRCTADDGKGNCTAAQGPDGKNIVVVGEGLKTGSAMTCVDTGSVVNCKPAS
jgi:hypothetical protein